MNLISVNGVLIIKPVNQRFIKPRNNIILMSQPTDKQIALLNELGVTEIPATGKEAFDLIGQKLGEGNGSKQQKKSYGGGYTKKTEEVTEIVTPSKDVDMPSYNEYIQKFVTAQKIVADIFPSVKVGTTPYFIKLFAIIHDL